MAGFVRSGWRVSCEEANFVRDDWIVRLKDLLGTLTAIKFVLIGEINNSLYREIGKQLTCDLCNFRWDVTAATEMERMNGVIGNGEVDDRCRSLTRL